MRYQILEPPHPIDPRELRLSSVLDLKREAPARPDILDLEEEAVNTVRASYPDALAMPIPLKVGSGKMVILGILPDMHAPRDPDAPIPFVMFVQAVAESAADKRLVARGQQWSRFLWKPPIVLPQGGVQVLPVEIRATDLETPVEVHAVVGRHRAADGRDRLAIRCEIAGIAMSLTFKDADLCVVRMSADPDLTITVEET